MSHHSAQIDSAAPHCSSQLVVQTRHSSSARGPRRAESGTGPSVLYAAEVERSSEME